MRDCRIASSRKRERGHRLASLAAHAIPVCAFKCLRPHSFEFFYPSRTHASLRILFFIQRRAARSASASERKDTLSFSHFSCSSSNFHRLFPEKYLSLISRPRVITLFLSVFPSSAVSALFSAMRFFFPVPGFEIEPPLFFRKGLSRGDSERGYCTDK